MCVCVLTISINKQKFNEIESMKKRKEEEKNKVQKRFNLFQRTNEYCFTIVKYIFFLQKKSYIFIFYLYSIFFNIFFPSKYKTKILKLWRWWLLDKRCQNG